MLSKEHGATVLGVCLVYDVFVLNRTKLLRHVYNPLRSDMLEHTHIYLQLYSMCITQWIGVLTFSDQLNEAYKIKSG